MRHCNPAFYLHGNCRPEKNVLREARPRVAGPADMQLVTSYRSTPWLQSSMVCYGGYREPARRSNTFAYLPAGLQLREEVVHHQHKHVLRTPLWGTPL